MAVLGLVALLAALLWWFRDGRGDPESVDSTTGRRVVDSRPDVAAPASNCAEPARTPESASGFTGEASPTLGATIGAAARVPTIVIRRATGSAPGIVSASATPTDGALAGAITVTGSIDPDRWTIAPCTEPAYDVDVQLVGGAIGWNAVEPGSELVVGQPQSGGIVQVVAKDGAPVAGAEVVARPVDSGTSAKRWPVCRLRRFDGVSDVRGECRVPICCDDVTFSVSARCGRTSAKKFISARAFSKTALRLELREELFDLRGRVVDERGSAIAGATVRSPGLPSAVTDECGRFETLTRLGEEGTLFRIAAPGHADAWFDSTRLDAALAIPAQAVDVGDIVLGSTCVVALVVSEVDGRPIPDAVLRISAQRPATDHGATQPVPASWVATSDERGVATVELEPGVEHLLTIDARGFERWVGPLKVRADERGPIEIRETLLAGAILRVEIAVDVDAPIDLGEGLEASATSALGARHDVTYGGQTLRPGVRRLDRRSTTSFSTESLASGTWTVTLRGNSIATATAELTLASGEERVVRLSPKRGRLIGGAVLDSAGASCERAAVRLICPSRDESWSTKSDDAGRFTFTVVDAAEAGGPWLASAIKVDAAGNVESSDYARVEVGGGNVVHLIPRDE